MKILLISGHGAGDPGAIGTCNGKTYKEADLTREVVTLLAAKLKGYASVTVYDQNRNAYTDYQNCSLSNLAHFENYDFVLEIHFNAFKADSGDGKTKGVEIFAKPGSNIEGNIVKNIAALGFTNRGVKSNGFAVINTARSRGARAALLEVCFIDDADDMKLFLAKKSLIVDAIVKGFGFSVSGETAKAQTTPTKTETPAAKESGVLYRVQVGAFSLKKNATLKCDALKGYGFAAIVVPVGALWKVQVGAFTEKANAEEMVKKLKASGYTGIVVKAATTNRVETISHGSTVRVRKGAKTYEGTTLANFVYNRDHEVKSIVNDRVVITYNGIVIAAVRLEDLILV
jgi:hypothetical protein